MPPVLVLRRRLVAVRVFGLFGGGLVGIAKLSFARTSRSAAPAADLRDRAALLRGRLPRPGANHSHPLAWLVLALY